MEFISALCLLYREPMADLSTIHQKYGTHVTSEQEVSLVRSQKGCILKPNTSVVSVIVGSEFLVQHKECDPPSPPHYHQYTVPLSLRPHCPHSPQWRRLFTFTRTRPPQAGPTYCLVLTDPSGTKNVTFDTKSMQKMAQTEVAF